MRKERFATCGGCGGGNIDPQGTVALHVSLLSLVNGANEGQVTGMITCSAAGDHQAGAGEQSWCWLRGAGASDPWCW